MTWLDKQINKLIDDTTSKYSEEIKAIEEIHPECCNEFQEHTPLKLVFLHYSLAIYTPIISRFFKHLFYVDLFCGSGVNILRSKRDKIIGSPFIATLNHRDRYDAFFFCDENRQYLDVLNSRLRNITKNSRFLQGDCNESLDSILNEIGSIRDKHVFFFVDPSAMQFVWKSMKKVLETYSDIIFNFMTHEIVRAVRSAFVMKDYKTRKLDYFFGDDSWKNGDTSKELVEIYKRNIKKVRERAIMESVNICDYYNLIFITNETKNKNPWMDGIRTAKREIEGMSRKEVENAFDKFNRGQKDLTKWL